MVHLNRRAMVVWADPGQGKLGLTIVWATTIVWGVSLPDARQRAAETKRARTREALLTAAVALFARQQGWHRTRIEDVAQRAGVSTATAYNHFKSKQALMGHVYAPLITSLLDAAARDVKIASPPIAAIRRHVSDLAVLARNNRDFTVSLIAAIQEQVHKVGVAPTEPDDVRTLVPLAEPLSALIAYGQESGALKAELSAADLGTYHTSALLYRVLNYPDESAHETASIVLSQLLPALVAEDRQVDWSPDEDLSFILKHMARDLKEVGPEVRRRLANHPLTREYLEAGFRLIVRECLPKDTADRKESEFFSFLSSERVIKEVADNSDQLCGENSFFDRWSRHSDYVSDTLAYSLWVKNWWPQTVAADNVTLLLSSAADIAQAAHEASYLGQLTVLNNPAFPVALIAAAISELHPEVKHSMGAVYRSTQEKWMLIYERTLARYGLRLRPGITIQDIADMLTALAEGLSLRIRSDSNVDFIDHTQKRALLGKAVMAVVVACVENGQNETLDDAFRKLFAEPLKSF